MAQHKNGNGTTPRDGECCSFCGARRSEVEIMFQGVNGASICNKCIENGYKIMRDNDLVPNGKGHATAAPMKMEELLNTHPGSASVMGLLFDTEHRVQLVMDRDVYDAEYFCCHPCDNHGSLKIKTSDLLTKFLPHVGHEPIVVDLPRE